MGAPATAELTLIPKVILKPPGRVGDESRSVRSFQDAGGEATLLPVSPVARRREATSPLRLRYWELVPGFGNQGSFDRPPAFPGVCCWVGMGRVSKK